MFYFSKLVQETESEIYAEHGLIENRFNFFCFAQQLSYSGTEIGDFQDKFNGSNSNDPGTLRCYYTKHYFKGKLNI